MKISAEYLASIVNNFEKLHDFGMKHGFVCNFRSFYEADRVVPNVTYPVQAEYVDGCEDCPPLTQSLKEACAAVGVATIEYDDYLYLDTPENRRSLAAWQKAIGA